ncbi:MAG: hypothetical protein ACREM1_19655 [Longimicrobiales bacterium]
MNRALATAAMRRAFVSRFRELIERLAESADSSTIEEALGMADSLSGLSLALERAAVIEAADRDPLAAARVRGIAARERLIEKVGGVLRLGEAADRLGVSSQAVTGRRTRRTILAVPLPNGEWVYPACQFTDDGLIPGLAAFLDEFCEVSPWTQLAVLVAPSARHGGRSALELLMAGETDGARSVAATYGEQG